MLSIWKEQIYLSGRKGKGNGGGRGRGRERKGREGEEEEEEGAREEKEEEKEKEKEEQMRSSVKSLGPSANTQPPQGPRLEKKAHLSTTMKTHA